MKKYLLILMLFALPFQYSWAAAAAYCQHETTHTSHFGHHSHHHVAQAEKLAEKSDEKSKLATLDDDCGYCHLSCQVTPTSFTPELTVPQALAPPVLQFISFSSYFPEGPKRPDRTLVA
ncbi:cation efflux protein, CzcI family [Noviherbaspirillum suwonense]|nr:cation efflux protein, CzcI family [Noviherbaspirillum suwonense]